MPLTTWVNSTWKTLRNNLGWGNIQVRRRISKPRGTWGIETERMENRTLLSAAGRLHAHAPVAADVAPAEPRAAFAFPNVNGKWHVTGQPFVSGEATFTQTENQVAAAISGDLLNVNMKGHFTKRHPHELFGTARVPNPITGNGKIAVKVHIEFGESTMPVTFSGDVQVKKLGLKLPMSGTYTGPN